MRELVRRLAASGDRTGALAAYERLSERLRTQLSIGPSAATRAAIAEVRAAAQAAPAQRTGAVVALLFTDLVGSTELLAQLGEDAFERVRRDHFALVRDVIDRHRGEEVKSLGDGLMAVFPSAVDAVACAVALQRELAERNARGPDAPLRLRVGVNAGEPFRSDDDWFGTPVVVAKRLCDAAGGGRILVSQLARDLVGGRGGFRFSAIDPLRLKGLPAPVAAAVVDWTQDGEEPAPSD